MTRTTNYSNAVNWLHNDYILCNKITEIDPTIWDNIRFDLSDDTEIFQWYLTSANESDVNWLEKSFGLKFTYSELLECFVLCVTHFGTSWDYVPCDCYNDEIADCSL